MSVRPDFPIQDFLRSRRSIRRFKDQQVPADMLQRVLETAIRAPNAHNRQPWRFVHLESAEKRAAMADALGAKFRESLRREGASEKEAAEQVARSRARILEAPAAVLLCLDISVLDHYEDAERDRGEQLMGVQSVALAGGQLLLAAHAEGLGGVWICAPLFAPEEVARSLDLPACWQAQGLILLGFPAQSDKSRPRKALRDVLLTR